MGKKIIFIGPLSFKRNIIGGAVIKNRNLLDYLKNSGFEIKVLDTDNWKEKKFFIIFNLILLLIFYKDYSKIILSTSSDSSYKFLKIFNKLNCRRKELYYFVIGGILPQNLEEKKYDINFFYKIKKIYIETETMANRLKKLGLIQTQYLPNFKKFNIKDRSEKKIELPLKLIFLARIEKEKGINLIFDMIEEINKKSKRVIVDFYGPISEKYKKEFEEKIKNFNECSYKGIIDMTDESYNKISKYDLMLFPTYYCNEGIPGSIIDAFISSIPILASKWNNYSEILNKNLAFEFEIGNKKEFIEKIEDILSISKNELSKKRKKCFEESKKYHIENVMIKVLEDLNK